MNKNKILIIRHFLLSLTTITPIVSCNQNTNTKIMHYKGVKFNKKNNKITKNLISTKTPENKDTSLKKGSPTTKKHIFFPSAVDIKLIGTHKVVEEEKRTTTTSEIQLAIYLKW